MVVNGQSYIKRFSEETGGMVILQHRLQRWWFLSAIWRTCFAILFGCDIGKVDFERPFNLFSLMDDFVANGKCKKLHPEVLPVIVALLQSGLKVLHRGNAALPMSQSHTSKRTATPLLELPLETQKPSRSRPTVDASTESGDFPTGT